MNITDAQLIRVAATIVGCMSVDADNPVALARAAKLAVKLAMLVCDEVDQLPKSAEPPDLEGVNRRDRG